MVCWGSQELIQISFLLISLTEVHINSFMLEVCHVGCFKVEQKTYRFMIYNFLFNFKEYLIIFRKHQAFSCLYCWPALTLDSHPPCLLRQLHIALWYFSCNNSHQTGSQSCSHYCSHYCTHLRISRR